MKEFTVDTKFDVRYANMDFIFASATKTTTARRLVVSYDIACQWHKHLRSRMVSIPTKYRLDLDGHIMEYVIPKFHIGAHGSSCQTKFSLNFRPHMGRTDGENIERGWAWLNPASLSTREMGLGARQDALDDQWSFWNWRIIVSLGLYTVCDKILTRSHLSALILQVIH